MQGEAPPCNRGAMRTRVQGGGAMRAAGQGEGNQASIPSYATRVQGVQSFVLICAEVCGEGSTKNPGRSKSCSSSSGRRSSSSSSRRAGRGNQSSIPSYASRVQGCKHLCSCVQWCAGRAAQRTHVRSSSRPASRMARVVKFTTGL